MKRIISMMCGLLFSTLLIAQQSTVYEIVEEMPEFSGGSAKMNEYLGNNIIYPEYAVDNNIEGRVIVESFTTNEGGKEFCCQQKYALWSIVVYRWFNCYCGYLLKCIQRRRNLCSCLRCDCVWRLSIY